MSRIELLVPVFDEPSPDVGTPAPRRTLEPGAQLTLIDNGKPKARQLLLLIAEGLREGLSFGEIVFYSKGSASRVIDEAEAAELAAASGAVIAGLGDCGACSACSVGDALRMELAGVPSTVVISDVFVGHVASFAGSLGFPGYHSVVVPHPVSSKSDDQLAGFARLVVDQVAEQLTGTGGAGYPDTHAPA